MKKATLIQLSVGLALFLIFGFLHDQLFIGALLAMGRNPKQCPLDQAMKSMDASKRRHDKKQSIKANSRLLRKDDAEKLELWETPGGPFWIPSGNAEAVLYDLAEQENGIYEQGVHGVKPGDIVLDCGANIGVYTRRALARGAKKVVAIEPAPENLKSLRRNFAKEIEEGRVIVYAKGVWDKDDVLPMNVDPSNSAGDSFVMKRDGSFVINLPLTTIDKLVAELGLDRVDFIKFDIEGAERNALRGARETLARFKPRMAVCVYHLADDQIAVPAAAREAWPEYKYDCGPCVVSDMHIMPEVYFFHGRS